MPYERSWHQHTKLDAPGALAKAAQRAIADNAPRSAMAVKFASIFEGSLLTSFLPVGYALQSSNVFPGLKNRLTRRKCRSVVKGAHALLWGNDDPLPQFRSVGGDWSTLTMAIETSGPYGAVLGCVATDYYEVEELCLKFPGQREAIEKNATTMWALGEKRPGAGGAQRMQQRWVTEVHMGY